MSAARSFVAASAAPTWADHGLRTTEVENDLFTKSFTLSTMTTKPKTKVLSVRLPEETVDQISRCAAAREWTVSEWVTKVLDRGLAGEAAKK